MNDDAERRLIDGRALRRALACFATGIAVVTTRGDGGAPVGLTVNSFNSVSLDPPLILWSIALTAPSLAAFRRNDAFAVNILAADQADICARFATPAPDKFSDVAWREGRLGVPVLDGTVAQFECRTHARYPGGDHEIHLGRVVALRSSGERPLVVWRGRLSTATEL
jgi:3-hydroxy-9,10-secoandrosta-1,3,5(10)-triene-9,17-dione monooxygenase reductase component